jgi:hypothetical protein
MRVSGNNKNDSRFFYLIDNFVVRVGTTLALLISTLLNSENQIEIHLSFGLPTLRQEK